MNKWRKETLELAVQLVLIEDIRVVVACKGTGTQRRDYKHLVEHIETSCDPEGWEFDDERFLVYRKGSEGFIRCMTPGPECEGLRATHVVQIGLQGVQTMFNPADFGL